MSHIKTIDSYFMPLSREQKELRALRMAQDHRRRKEQRICATNSIVNLAAEAMEIVDLQFKDYN